MQTSDIRVCDMGLFGDVEMHFWLDELGGLLERFPRLKFPHKQNFYTLIIVEKAEGEITVDNFKIIPNTAKAIIIKPGCISSVNLNQKAKGKIICFSDDFFSLRYNNNILYQFSFLKQDSIPYIRLNKQQITKWRIFLNLITEEFKMNKRETKNVLRSYLNIILFELERMYNPSAIVNQRDIKQEKVTEFEKLIDKHFATKKLPSAYAKLLHLSPNYLNKIYKEVTGQTAGELIRKRITIEAQRLLHYTDYSVSEIADKLGFETTSYFVTFFKKQTRTTPEQFRKNQNQ